MTTKIVKTNAVKADRDKNILILVQKLLNLPEEQFTQENLKLFCDKIYPLFLGEMFSRHSKIEILPSKKVQDEGFVKTDLKSRFSEVMAVSDFSNIENLEERKIKFLHSVFKNIYLAKRSDVFYDISTGKRMTERDEIELLSFLNENQTNSKNISFVGLNAENYAIYALNKFANMGQSRSLLINKILMQKTNELFKAVNIEYNLLLQITNAPTSLSIINTEKYIEEVLKIINKKEEIIKNSKLSKVQKQLLTEGMNFSLDKIEAYLKTYVKNVCETLINTSKYCNEYYIENIDKEILQQIKDTLQHNKTLQTYGKPDLEYINSKKPIALTDHIISTASARQKPVSIKPSFRTSWYGSKKSSGNGFNR